MANTRSVTEEAPWSLAEVVDLPLALADERSLPNRESELAAARKELLGAQTDSPTNHGALVHAWLRRWQRKSKEKSPGTYLEDSLRIANRLALIAGVIVGLAAASDRLLFKGPEPLNVFALVGIFVLAPLLVSAVLILLIAARQPGQGTALQHFFLFFGRKIAVARESWLGHRAEPWRSGASWSDVSRSLGKNGLLLQAPVLAISQRFALGFGVGLLVMLQLRVSFWELAFGWQSTLAAPDSVWHGLTRALSAPWSWFWPDGAPTLQQIASTRYSRMAGSPPLDPSASRAWWPFLAATIAVWSILLRGVILLALRITQACRLRRFNALLLPDAELLARRLAPGWSVGTAFHSEAPATGSELAAPARRPLASVWHAVIADEPDPAMPKGEDLQNLLGLQVDRVSSFQFDDSLSPVTAEALRAAQISGAALVIVMPASRDPIGEVNDTLRAIEKIECGGLIVLRGAPERLSLWKRKLATWRISFPVEYFPLS